MKLQTYSRLITLLLLLIITSLQLQAQEKLVFELTGKVLLPDGSPAAGATVEVTWPKTYIKTVSDDFGQIKMKLAPGSYGITAKSDPFVLPVPQKFFEIDSKGSINKPFILQLETGANLTGRVIDKATREPVPGTKLTLEDIGDTTSAEDGSFIFSCIPKNNYLLTAYKAGYAQPVIQFNTINKGQIDLLIELKPEVILRGRVTDEKGNPIPNASIRQNNRQISLHSTRTDKEGHYELRGLEPESHLSFEVYADHFKPIYEKEIAIGSNDRELTVNYQMIPEVEGKRSIYGHVFKADGSMAQGVKVGCGFSKTYVNYPSTTTDERGYYLLQEINAKKSLITVEGKGYAPDCKYAEADKNLEIDFVLEPGHFLEGKIVDEEGNPLQGALLSPSIVSTPEMIKYWGAPGLQMSLDIFEITDINGHFRLDEAQGFLSIARGEDLNAIVFKIFQGLFDQ
jgi:protocatechuate 3,4-dioxygenase beta subunit